MSYNKNEEIKYKTLAPYPSAWISSL